MPFHTALTELYEMASLFISINLFSYQEHLKTCPIRKVVVRFMPLI